MKCSKFSDIRAKLTSPYVFLYIIFEPTVQPHWVCRGFSNSCFIFLVGAALQGVDREFQETASLEKCRGSQSGWVGSEVGSLSPNATGGGEMRVQPSGEGYDKLKGTNDTGGNHCVVQVAITRLLPKLDLKHLNGAAFCSWMYPNLCFFFHLTSCHICGNSNKLILRTTCICYLIMIRIGICQCWHESK